MGKAATSNYIFRRVKRSAGKAPPRRILAAEVRPIPGTTDIAVTHDFDDGTKQDVVASEEVVYDAAFKLYRLLQQWGQEKDRLLLALVTASGVGIYASAYNCHHHLDDIAHSLLHATVIGS